MTRQKVDLTKMFSAATQMSDAELEINNLQAEVNRLRALQAPELEVQIATLREQLRMQSGVQEISIIKIRPNPGQPRKTFSSLSIDSMVRTLDKDGQLHPIILIPEADHFDLFDGERRWRAAKKLGWQIIKAVTMPRPQDLHRKALITTLHREDLNPLDKAEALLKEISEQTGIDTAEAPRILSTAVRRLDYQKRMKQVGELIAASEDKQNQVLDELDLTDLEKSVFKVLLGIGLNPGSVTANDFRMLSLFPDLQIAIRESNLKAAHAMVLQRLSAKKLGMDEKKTSKFRIEATQKVVEQSLTLAETQELVNQIIAKYVSKPATNTDDKRLANIMRGFKKINLNKIERSNLENFRQSLQQKLQEIEAALQIYKDN
ncbi:ParB/RepB/Spo0J family partition protein [Nostoc sp. WHI]|uniref:ParB/RepB/Spo0J family partition protein n=1 Tax=Nostoc sp. WHI TaxID=2650611 RepID=UPI0018C80DFD|nr:ParB/RepB/Spo0J family partition protein [Nostoc sp. WHI]MBG1267786.1 ParB/RepB/Spo0J family partition protein [Nostoc sp. WHI]